MLTVEKFENNPIISPKDDWETNGTFNPAAIKIGSKIYIIYRSITKNNISVLKLAISKDGYTIDEKIEEPILLPRKSFELHPSIKEKVTKETRVKGKVEYKRISGSSYCGIEDPRVTIIDNKIYITYVAFNGIDVPGIAITSIRLKDFLNFNFEFEEPKLISPPAIPDKGGAILEEKINNKYVLFHRIFPNIWIDYKDTLNFGENEFIFGKAAIKIRIDKWDSRKIIVGAPPIKTDFGFVLFYNGVSGWDDLFTSFGLDKSKVKYEDGYKYKIGIMVLDKENIEKVIYRCEEPLIVPSEWYEGNITYCCGAVLDKDKFFIYYGASDKYVSVATVEKSLIKEKVRGSLNLKNVKVRKIRK